MSRRVLIKTLPLHTNYGGIVQAYALQRAIRDLGHRAFVDTADPVPLRRRALHRMWAVRRAVRMLLPARLDWNWRAGREVLAPQQRFVRRHLSTPSAVKRADTPRGRARLARRFDTFVVGSDQVWRAAYAEIPEEFLEVIEEFRGERPRRISYAASFGRDDIDEYSERERARATELIRRFDAVSVREESGIRICAEEFGVEAERHLDPTMLLTPAHYRGLVARSGTAAAPAVGRTLVYRLDATDDMLRAERSIAERVGAPTMELLPTASPRSYGEYAADRARFDRPSVEAWLASIASADFVVTDSYHGCVFSILFNRPFLVHANARRGATRFDSLLGVFGLEHHRAGASADGIDERVFAPDWERVNRVLDAERARATAYLSANL
ncbi:polysaccharide pyruvyl transferase family protein [Agromyces sp. SYSU T00266]|uniref:polysaccharide pyruvyl transferase family protein n=1 Tax=Agromyces zhanjiangensis TaxID=3158562 RepID=UPI0033995E5D